MDQETKRMDRIIVLAMQAGATKERRRIRKLIAPHLKALGDMATVEGAYSVTEAVAHRNAINRAVRAPKGGT